MKTPAERLAAIITLMRDSAAQASPGPWQRDHSAISSRDGKMVALCDFDQLKSGHGGYPGDPTKDSANGRWVTATNPAAMLKLFNLIEEVCPAVAKAATALKSDPVEKV